jgi:hypothetical protein
VTRFRDGSLRSSLRSDLSRAPSAFAFIPHRPRSVRAAKLRGFVFRANQARSNVCAWSPSGSVVAPRGSAPSDPRAAIRPGKPMPVAGETAHVTRRWAAARGAPSGGPRGGHAPLAPAGPATERLRRWGVWRTTAPGIVPIFCAGPGGGSITRRMNRHQPQAGAGRSSAARVLTTRTYRHQTAEMAAATVVASFIT